MGYNALNVICAHFISRILNGGGGERMRLNIIHTKSEYSVLL